MLFHLDLPLNFKCLLFLLSVGLFFNEGLFAQTILYGNNNYVEYQVGNLPVVIAVSHGGNLDPPSIPDRSCNNAVLVADAFTIETALEIKNKFFLSTGCYPHLIISHLKRSKLDPNRNIAEGACGNPAAENAYNEFHGFIAQARNTANAQYNFNTFFLDLHGHGNPIQRIELGYLLYDDELELSDSALNSTPYINYSSIKNLALNNQNNFSHAQMLRGPMALGTMLGERNYPCVPSMAIPFPGTNTNYFSGGYITANHTCFATGVAINGLQMELNYSGIRDNAVHRISFASAFCESLIEYLNAHFSISWNACNPQSSEPLTKEIHGAVYPNPASIGEPLYLNISGAAQFQFSLFNPFGKCVRMGEITESLTEIKTQNLSPGLYFLKVNNPEGIPFFSSYLVLR
ncbi:MAG: T9SS type A sorting domain-containing protein [Bacteroidota bacterium]